MKKNMILRYWTEKKEKSSALCLLCNIFSLEYISWNSRQAPNSSSVRKKQEVSLKVEN